MAVQPQCQVHTASPAVLAFVHAVVAATEQHAIKTLAQALQWWQLSSKALQGGRGVLACWSQHTAAAAAAARCCDPP